MQSVPPWAAVPQQQHLRAGPKHRFVHFVLGARPGFVLTVFLHWDSTAAVPSARPEEVATHPSCRAKICSRSQRRKKGWEGFEWSVVGSFATRSRTDSFSMAQRLMPWAKACLGLWRSWKERRGASSCIWYLLWSLINDVQKSGRRQAQHPDADESREERAIVGGL